MIVPGVKIEGFLGAFVAAALLAILKAVPLPLITALCLPYMLAVGFLLVLPLGAWMVLVAADLSDHTFSVDGFFWVLLVALVAAVTAVLAVLLGTNQSSFRRPHASVSFEFGTRLAGPGEMPDEDVRAHEEHPGREDQDDL